MTNKEEINTFIRDVTKVGSIPKSEVRSRLNVILEAHSQAYLQAYKEKQIKSLERRAKELIKQLKLK